MEIDLNQPVAKLLKLIKPSFFEYFGSDAKSEWKYLLDESKGPGGSDRVRSYIKEYDGFNPFNKGGLAKKKKSKPKSNKGSIDYRKTGMFYGGMAKKK